MMQGPLLRALGLVAAGLVAAAMAAEEPRAKTVPAAPKAAPPSAFDRIVKQAAEAREAGRLDEAAGYYGKALERKPDWIDGHWSLATLLYDLDRYAEARDHFGKVVAVQPRNGLALALHALCEVRLRNYDPALAELQQAQVVGVENPDVRSVAAFQLALLLNRAGNPDAAFAILRVFAEQGKDGPDVITAFGLSVLRLALMPEDVPAEKQEMIRLAGRGGYHMARGRRTVVGRLALEELISRYPTEANVYYALGIYIAADDPDGAVEAFRRELRFRPDHYPSMLQIASIETRRGHPAEALALAEEAARIAPNVPAARLVLGRALLDLGQVERAIPELEKGAELAPESPDLQFALSRAYQRAGRVEDAQRARQEFQRLDRAFQEREKEASPVAAPEAPAPPDPSHQDRGQRQPSP